MAFTSASSLFRFPCGFQSRACLVRGTSWVYDRSTPISFFWSPLQWGFDQSCPRGRPYKEYILFIVKFLKSNYIFQKIEKWTGVQIKYLSSSSYKPIIFLNWRWRNGRVHKKYFSKVREIWWVYRDSILSSNFHKEIIFQEIAPRKEWY